MKAGVKQTKLLKYTQKQPAETDDLLAVEEPMEIRLGFGALDEREEMNIAVTMRTPGDDFSLAVGFLFTEGIIEDITQILSIKYCSDQGKVKQQFNIVRVELKPGIEVDTKKLDRNFYTTSSCGICGKASIDAIATKCKVIKSNIRVEPNIILQLPSLINNAQTVFKFTGGIHAATLFNSLGEIILIKEDVGRHNALDKLIGVALQQNISFENTLLLLSGRASFELIQKAAMAGIPVVCAIGSPSSLAVETAKSFNITLVGFLKNDRFNIYTNHYRINI